MVQGVPDAENHVEAGVFEVIGQLSPVGSNRPDRYRELRSQRFSSTNHRCAGVRRNDPHAETSEADR
jgi:hypothetical protein